MVLARDEAAFAEVADDVGALVRLGATARCVYLRDGSLWRRLTPTIRLLRQWLSSGLEDVLSGVTVVLAPGLDPRALAELDAHLPEHIHVDDGNTEQGHLEAFRRELELELVRAVDDMVRRQEFSDVEQHVARTKRDVCPATAAVLSASAAAATLDRTGRPSADMLGRAAGAFDSADQAWAGGAVDEATLGLAAGIRLLFDPELHAEADSFPLATDPSGFLAPMGRSQMFQDLVSAPSAIRTRSPRVSSDGSVLVLTGSYPRFAAPLVDALRAGGRTVITANMADHDPGLRWLGPNTRALAMRVAAHPDGQSARQIAGTMPDPQLVEGFSTVVAEWGDRGAMWASLTVPRSTRLVVRLHGMDLFSPWVHLIDWTAVDDLIVVSRPFEALARSVLGPRLADVEVHVVEHSAPPSQFRPATHDVGGNPSRTLGMIGWGKVVKDPAWTLDLLELLLEHDPTWQLMLVGDPLSDGGSERRRAYVRAVHERLAGRLADHVRHVPQTPDVVPHAQQMGFVISSSRRESFHLGLLEGVLCGAVPVVRDWPVYGGQLARGGLYPREWITGSDPADAAQRIAALQDPDDRAEASRRAREQALERFDPQRFAQRVRSVVFGT